MASLLKLYGVAPSQPTRAIMFLCAIKKYPFEFVKVSPGANTPAKQEYIQSVNPSGKIPGICVVRENKEPFALFESAAIMAYLCNLNEWHDLYPLHDLERRALIDEYLHWHAENTRAITAGFMRPLLQSTFKEKSEWDPYLLAAHRRTALNALQLMEERRLSAHAYVVDDALSIADICCYEEVMQIKAWNFVLQDAGIETQREFANVYAWMERMESLPGHEESHRVVHKLTPWMMERYKEYESLYARVASLAASRQE